MHPFGSDDTHTKASFNGARLLLLETSLIGWLSS
jgi:hypothetical protein